MFQIMDSQPLNEHFIFDYRVIIENLGSDTVQLLSRHWCIWDSCSNLQEVKGLGVVGQQPILKPGDKYQYMSCCPLSTNMGKLSGTYGMMRISDGHEFDISIPSLNLIVPFKLN
jgi:ApaG protein